MFLCVSDLSCELGLPMTERLPVLAAVSGLLLWLAWPPLPFSILLFIAFVPLLYAGDVILSRYQGNHPFRKAWLTAYAGLFIWNALTTWWVCLSTVPGGIFALVVNTLIMTVPFMLYFWTRSRVGVQASWVMLITGWIAYEYFHMRWELTWPWLTLGNGFATTHTWVQWYEFTGAYGGTAWILLVNILVYRVWRKPSLRHGLTAFAAVLLPVLISFGIYFNTPASAGEPAEVALLQTDFNPHTEKFELPSHQILRTMLELSEEALDQDVEYLIWPETALTENINMRGLRTHPSLSKIRRLADSYPNLKVITGINAYDRYASLEEAPAHVRIIETPSGPLYLNTYNTALQLQSGQPIQHYHKGKLVPGPERFPYYEQLKWLNAIIPGMDNFMGRLSTGPERTNLVATDSTAVATAICYESVFGEFVTGYVNNGADLIFVITNDGWWGDSPGRRQHKAYAKLRAIETRRDVARSANTGISCFINQRGDVVADAGRDNAQVLRGTMYKNDKITTYVKHGDAAGRTSLWIAAALILVTFVRTMQSSIKP